MPQWPPHGARGIPPLLAQGDEERLHGILAQRGWISSLLPRNGGDVRKVVLASPWPLIPQLDKLPETIYGKIVWIRGLFIGDQNTPPDAPTPDPASTAARRLGSTQQTTATRRRGHAQRISPTEAFPESRSYQPSRHYTPAGLPDTPLDDIRSAMRSQILILAVMLAGCQSSQSVHTHGMDLSAAKRTQLERKATGGDAAAAWRLYHYHALEHHDDTAADPWLRRAAKLDHPQAQRLLAYLIKEYKHSPTGFGANAPAAVQELLEQSAQSEGAACYDLASAYAEGYFGAPNHAKARTYFRRGADLNNRMCWEKVSHYYRHALGGPRDDAEAYYWISLEARCVDPRSMGGEETWAAREEIASHLSLATLEREWKRIDAFISQVTAKKIAVDHEPFLSGAIDPKLEAEGRRFAQQRENEHRKKCKSTKA